METQEIKKEQELNKNAEKQTETQAQEGTHFEHVKETLELLYKTFPKAFVKDGEARPLKIGIFEDLKEKCASVEGLSISKVRAALRLYTSRLKYLYSVKEGAPRIDIDGNECGDTVSAEHLKAGTEVLVLSSEQRFVFGVVAENAQKDTVYVTLKSGLTVNLPLERVLLPKKAK
mgnify:CR=1 FL=1